jgi:hypothetical protein
MLNSSSAAVPARSHDFKLLVIQKLTLLETMMISIAGNGQPGRLQQLEDKVRSHDRLFWLLTGAGAVFGWFLERIFG